MANKQLRFTEAEVEYLIRERKYIKEVPRPSNDGNHSWMRAKVYRNDNGYVPITGLIAIARAPIPLPGVPADLPSASLEWHGIRIRGIDKETRHDNPDGSIVSGWHEHIWCPEYNDECAVACPEPRHKDMRRIFAAGLERWNIEVVREQMEVEK